MLDILANRRDALRSALGLGPAEAVLITSLIDIRWLTGFTGSYGGVLITDEDSILGSDGRYEGQIATQVSGVEVHISRAVHADLIRIAGQRGRSTVVIDESHVSVAMARTLAAVDASFAVEPRPLPMPELRLRKDAAEIANLREACRISDEALADLIENQMVGWTEQQVAVWIERRMIDLGAEAVAFETIVAAGENSATPHHHPTKRELRMGDLLKIDFGARVGGYHADETRTFVLGPPQTWQQEIHDVVRRAQAAGVAALKEGVRLQDVDSAARSVIADAGYADSFTHGLGHGVGLVIHEEPFFSATGTAILTAGTALTVEPGIYLPGRGGVRIEDTLVVGPDGAESLTTTPRELIVLG
jgi:Xaa-Pro aminopeptidase